MSEFIKVRCVDAGINKGIVLGEDYLIRATDQGKCGLTPIFRLDMSLIGEYKGSRFLVIDSSPGPAPEYTGGSSSYYDLEINGVTVSCNDIIEKLGMNFAEGNVFKACWRSCASRNLGKKKAGAKADGLYDAEKVVFFGERMVAQAKERK